MKVALFVYSLGPGGAERQVSVLAEGLIECGHEVELFLVHERIFYELPSEVKITILDDAPIHLHPVKKLLKLLPLARKYAKLCNADISLSFMNRPNYINVLSRFFGNRARIVVAERGAPRVHFEGLEAITTKALIRMLYPRADLVIANSQGSAKDLRQYFHIKNAETIYNGFDLKEIERLSREPIAENFSRFTFITVGRLDQGKSHRLLIEAIALSQVEADLVIIGEGPEKENLEKLVAHYGLQARIHLLGVRKNPFAYLARADCFVFASTNEGFPNVLVEAMACGLPVISTDCPFGPAEILQNGEYGILVRNGDAVQMAEAMKKMYNNDALREGLAQKAKTGAQTFEKSKIVKKYIEMIEKVCNGSKK